MTLVEGNYMAQQFNGPIIRSLLHAMWAVWNDDESLLTRFAEYELSYGKITTSELNQLGVILAIPRPYSMTAGDDESFLYGAQGYDYPQGWRQRHGIGSVTENYGGLLSDSQGAAQSTGTVNDVTYIQFMKDMVTLRKTYSIEAICQLVEDLITPVVAPADPQVYYALEFIDYNDIRITIDSLFSRYSEYLQVAFNRTFTGSPRVYIAVGAV